MMSRHFRLSSELSRVIAKRLSHAKNQLSVLGSFYNQFVTDVDIYTHTQTLIYSFNSKDSSLYFLNWSLCCS